jgi:hypothetical protein
MKIVLKGQSKEGRTVSVPLEVWHNEYRENDKYLHYDFFDVPEIVDLYKVNPETGIPEFERCTFEYTADTIINSDFRNYVKKPHDKSRLDQFLMPVKSFEGSFFRRILKRIKQRIVPRSNPNKIPFSRFESKTIKIGLITIIVSIVIPIILFIIEKIFFS